MLSFSCYYCRILLKNIEGRHKKDLHHSSLNLFFFSNGFSSNGVMMFVLISIIKMYFRFQIMVL